MRSATWSTSLPGTSTRIPAGAVRNKNPLSILMTYTGPGRQIAGQERKHFAEKSEMERYLQGRIKAYAHLFTEISPPIPAEEKRRFCVNGVLLPGYTVEITMDQAVSDLLALAEDDDLAALAQDTSTRAPVQEGRKEAPAKRPTHSKLHKRKCAPTR